MPRKTYVKLNTKKRYPMPGRYRRRNRRIKSSKTLTVNKSPFPVAPRFLTKLKYNTLITGTAGNITSNNIYRLNSIYDPEFTGVGHQPYGHDTLQSLYNRYRVYYVTGFIEIFSTSTAAPVNWCIVPVNENSAPTNQELAREIPMARTFTTSPEKPYVYKFRYSPRKITGVSKEVYRTDDRYQATFGTDPAEYINLVVMNKTDISGQSSAFQWNITLTYHVECWDPKELAQS